MIKLEHVSKSYTAGIPALNDVSLDIEEGEFVFIVGDSGSGKSTLIKLLLKELEPTEGTITINNKKLNKIKRRQIPKFRRNIGVVFQDYKYYCFSIAENVAMNDYRDTPETEERILKALDEAGLGEKIASLPKGIHTQLGKIFDKDGIQLSGGELQKLALARVLFKDPSIVLLDEPSSALDPIAEYELNRSLAENAEGKTVIFISHRLSTTRMADRIYMFDGGRITECGSHDALMQLNGKYAEMYRIQAKRYLET